VTSYPTVQQALDSGAGRTLAAIPVTRLASGHESAILVHVINGPRKGPRVAVVLGTHGGETFVTELFRVFLTQLNHAELNGTLMVIPMANVTAFEAATRHTPTDAMNLNRLFPGNAHGWYTEMLAHALTTEVVTRSDWVFDYHCPHDKARANRYTYTLDPVTEYGRAVHELAVASGAAVLHAAPRVPGSLMDYCRDVNIPTLVPEIGGSPAVDQSHMRIGLAELRNSLRHLRMLPGEVERLGPQRIVRKSDHLRPPCGGLFVPELTFDDLAVPIEGRPLLGTVYDVSTLESVGEIRSPYERYILMSLRVLSKVDPGDYAYSIGDLDSAELLN
jgi:predicted deacylase